MTDRVLFVRIFGRTNDLEILFMVIQPIAATRTKRFEQFLLHKTDGLAASLLQVIHHIVADEWSLDILYRELSSLYESYACGQEPALPELPIQYADYAVWQREWLQGEILERQLDYWKTQLAGIPPALMLPTDRPDFSVQTHHRCSSTWKAASMLINRVTPSC